MNVLALDTALQACSAAVAVDGRLVARHHEVLHRGHAEKIVPIMEQVLSMAGVSADGLDLIAVTVGPGTFTGVRIGLSAARGLALPHRTPVLGVSTLQALAWGDRSPDPVFVAIDARRGEIYAQAFDADRHPAGVARAITPADVDLADGPVRIVGNGLHLLSPLWPQATGSDAAEMPDAGVMALAAAARASEAIAGQPPSPLYLRAPDAKLPSSAPSPA